MLRRLLFIIILTSAFASISYSFDPPWQSPPYPWGRDTTEWVWRKISSGPTQAYYNPEEEMFYLCGGDPVQWPTLLIELFIEMELEFDFGNVYPQETDAEQNFIDQIYLHGTIQSDVPALFRVITEYKDDDNVPNSTTSERAIKDGQQTNIDWAISTDGGFTFERLKGDNHIRYYKLESWHNAFIVRMTTRQENMTRSGTSRLNTAIFPLPQN